MLDCAVALGATDAMVENIGHIELARKRGLTLRGGHRLNITNSDTALALSEVFCDLLLSPELTLPRLRDIRRAIPSARAMTYGRAPLMVTEKCVGKEIGSCENCQNGRAALRDRRGVDFPTFRIFDHRSLIVNSLPLYMGDRQAELDRAGLSATHFVFTTESREEIARVISAYKKNAPPKGEVRRIK